MKTTKVIRLQPGQYRPHRFPPVAEPVKETSLTTLDEGESWQDNQFELQQRLEEGFQQGLQQGHDEGLRQGLEQGKQQGLLDGQKEGFQQGYKNGEQAGKDIFNAAVRPVNALFDKIAAWQAEKEREQRQFICELVQKVAQQVIRAELTLMPQQILALVDETLEALPGKTEKVVVHLNPQDLERITNINAELPAAWKLVANKDLPVGGCQLVTDHAEADASCDARLEACMENVREHLLDGDNNVETSAPHAQEMIGE
ncbi:flagellar assembly protein FliH [Photobacterium proteolyticum]|uniref:Flagellar assembly protein FliH n=1 Tax=Photobacterium proteolyticum TaxID=1903952 RepID=A0A1Q9GVP6_9GAMM|nr:flagellar assembly protein FliH [Photobacterium proteolyticum]OLQ79152.1 flagellar assembly protein FliH [Photobacterium proteolyticum]